MKPEEKKLLQNYRKLSDSDKAALIRFAEFLTQSGHSEEKVFQPPIVIAAKENESVVGAIKRLSASYPMLDKAKMLNETSTLMTQHVMHGRDRDTVIQELEVVFKTQYELIKKDNETND